LTTSTVSSANTLEDSKQSANSIGAL